MVRTRPVRVDVVVVVVFGNVFNAARSTSSAFKRP